MAKELKNLFLNKIHDRILKNVAGKYAKGCLIDIGCGIKPYASLVAPFIKQHVGIDHALSLHCLDQIDLLGTAYNIPVDDNEFDTALCTSVLEHLEEPECALRECYRVLKSESYAIYSIPFIWHLHEMPRDFFRFSKYGIKYLFEKSGFEIVEIIPVMGFWGTFGQMFVYYLYRFNWGPLRWLRIIDLFGLLIQILAHLLDRIDCAENWTCLYVVVAKKP